MIAAFADNSLVGASGKNRLVVLGAVAVSPAAGPSPGFGGFGLLAKLGRIFTGIISTFLNEERKSFLSACLLTFDIKKDSVEAACSEICLSQSPTRASQAFLKKS